MLPSLLLPLWDSDWAPASSQRCARSWRATRSAWCARSSRRSSPSKSGIASTDPPGSGKIRVQFVASQLVGVVMARYILELEPFKSLPVAADRRDHRTEPAALPHRRPAWAGLGVGSLDQPLMLGVVVDGHCLVDQQHGHTTLDPVGAPKPRVVEHIAGQKERATVLAGTPGCRAIVDRARSTRGRAGC